MKHFKEKVQHIADEIVELLVTKNEKYGNSALDPIRVFSKVDATEQIKVRLDDKLSRLKQAHHTEDEDVILDLLGYLILLRLATQETTRKGN